MIVVFTVFLNYTAQTGKHGPIYKFRKKQDTHYCMCMNILLLLYVMLITVLCCLRLLKVPLVLQIWQQRKPTQASIAGAAAAADILAISLLTRQ
jgi:hypothetical protein